MTGELKVTQKLNQYEFGVEIRVMREGINRNKWDYQNVDQYYKTFVGQPILIAYVGNRIGDGHNMRETKDPITGAVTYSFMDATAERIVGTISDDEADVTIQEIDGQKWIIAKGKLFAFYARELVEKIVTTGVMEVSAETEVMDSYTDGDNEVFTRWAGLGVTILGDGVAPAIPGARIAELQALQEEFAGLKLKAASYEKNEEVVEETEPQEKTQKKGVKKRMDLYSKKQCAELSAKFDGYKVMMAGKDTDGLHICLMAEDGSPATYIMGSENDVVVPENIMKVNTQTVFCFGEDKNIFVDSADMTDVMEAKLIEAKNELATCKAELEKVQDEIAKMNEAETKRRVQAAKDKAISSLEAFNANRAETVEESAISGVIADVEAGVYTNAVDAEGVWDGDKMVEMAVLSICAKADIEMKANEAKANQTKLVWDRGGSKEADDGTVAGLLAKKGIKE